MNEYYIQDGRGLFNSKYICKRGAGADTNQVWYAPGELSENNHKGIYTGKLLAGTLKEHCLDIQEQAENMAECLTKQLVAVEGISENLKSRNQMEWVRRMNSIRNRVDEIVMTEIVYKI